MDTLTAPGQDPAGPIPLAPVVLVGAPGSGKSALAAALLTAHGAPPLSGPPGAGPAAGALRVGALRSGDAVVPLLDPPGSPDLAGALHSALRVAGCALFVVSPVQGVDPRTVALWEALERLPRVLVLTQLDRPGADADEAVAVCRRVLGEGVQPLHVPLHDDDGGVGGLLDLLHLTVSQDGDRRAADPEHVQLVADLRGELVEAVLTGSADDAVFTRFLDDQEPPGTVLDRELAAAVGRGDLQPVLVAAPRRAVGLRELGAVLAAVSPRAADQHRPAATVDGAPLHVGDGPDAPLVAEVVRTGLVRVWAGRLRSGADLLVGGRACRYDGPPAGPGELVAVELGGAPGEPVSQLPLTLQPWSAPPAQFPVGVPEDADLAERVRQDPVARLEVEPRTGQLLLWTYGPEHAEALLDGVPSAPVRLPPGARPVRVTVSVPAWAERPVRSDLLARGGSVAEVREDPAGVELLAELPPAELPGYALALARASAGTGTFRR